MQSSGRRIASETHTLQSRVKRKEQGVPCGHQKLRRTGWNPCNQNLVLQCRVKRFVANVSNWEDVFEEGNRHLRLCGACLWTTNQ